MKSIYTIILCFSALLLVGCKSKTVYVPVETVKTEYRDKLVRDSIHQVDSVFFDRYLKGDTMFITKEKYKYVFKDKLVRDTVRQDSIVQVPYPVKGDPIPYVNGWQNFQIWCGRILLLLLAGYFIVKKFF